VQLLACKTNGRSAVRIANLRLNRNVDARVSDDRLEDLLGESNADFVGAIVMYDEPTESITDYAPYSLTVSTDNDDDGGDDDDDDDD
jgi:hypothetical protein